MNIGDLTFVGSIHARQFYHCCGRFECKNEHIDDNSNFQKIALNASVIILGKCEFAKHAFLTITNNGFGWMNEGDLV
jgi:hypothetical protein